MSKYLKADEIIDLELFIAEDERESEDYKNNRDFEFYSQASDFDKSDDINLLSFWIEKMRSLSNKVSIGKFSQMLFAIYALILILLGTLSGYIVLSLPFSHIGISVNSALIVIAISALFIPSLLLLPFFSKILNWKMSFFTKLIFGQRGSLDIVEQKNKNYFATKGKFLGQIFGFAFVLSMFFSSYFHFEKNEYKFKYTQEHNFSPSEMHSVFKTVAFPFSLTFGEGILYPSIEDINLADNGLPNIDEAKQGVWKNFWLTGIFVYGLLPRLIVFFIYLTKGRKSFGKYKILNDRDINILLNRMKLSSSSKTNWQGLKNDKDCKNLLILRKDLIAYTDIIKQKAIKQTSFDKFNLYDYEFLSDFFSEDFNDMQSSYKDFTIAFLSDDYNDEVFENLQNLINTYPEKTLNVLLLGRYDKASNSFFELVSIEKSWWERKLNAISTQNINIY